MGFSSGANPGSISKTADGLIKSWLWTGDEPDPHRRLTHTLSFFPSLRRGHAKLPNLSRTGRICLLDTGPPTLTPDDGGGSGWPSKTPVDEPYAAFERRIEALEAEKQQRDQAELNEVRREANRLKEYLNVTS